MIARRSLEVGLAATLVLIGCGGGEPAKAPARAAPVASAAPEPADACATAIAKVVKSAKEPIHVTAYISGGNAAFAKAARALDVAMARIGRLAPGAIDYRLVDPRTTALEAEARAAGVREGPFQDPDAGEDSSGVLRGFAGVAFRYRAEHDAIVALDITTLKSVGFVIGGRLHDIVAKGDDKKLRIGIVSGKDELSLAAPDLVIGPPPSGKPPPNLIAIFRDSLPYYEFSSVDLKGGAAAIDPTLRALIVTQPGRAYADAELRAIDAFMMRGDKGLFVMASAVNVAPGAGLSHAELETFGLERLLAGYGVELRREAIFDWGSPLRITALTPGGAPASFPLPSMVHAIADPRVPRVKRLFDRDFAGFFGVDELVLPFSSPLVAHPDKQPRASFRVVAHSSPEATVVAGSPLDLGPPKLAPSGEAGARVIGLVVEGEVRGAFGGPASRAPDRMLFLASSEFATNPLARAGSPQPGGARGDETLAALANPYAQRFLKGTILAFKNTLDWLGDEDGLTACAAPLLP